jgi:membrane dipeptidase
VDGHLDLAENVTLFGRDLTASVEEIRAQERRSREQATVSLPEMQRGGIAVAIATVTAGFLVSDVGEAFEPRSALYSTPEQAQAQALRQIALYRRWERERRVRLILSSADLEHHLELWRADGLPGLVLLMEGADPIVRVSDLSSWWRRGLRMIGLTFGDTRYGAGVAGGSAELRPGGLTAAGAELLSEMAARGFSWDVSHLTEEGIWQGLETGMPRVCASHANAQALTPTNRHLSDPVIDAIGARGGVIGVVLYNRFLEAAWRRDGAVAVTVERDVRRHIDHIAGVAGWAAVGIGSDLDGGLGREESPHEIETIADLRTIGSVVPEHARDAVLGGNWLTFLRGALP